jgi:hypothetical protein
MLVDGCTDKPEFFDEFHNVIARQHIQKKTTPFLHPTTESPGSVSCSVIVMSVNTYRFVVLYLHPKARMSS